MIIATRDRDFLLICVAAFGLGLLLATIGAILDGVVHIARVVGH